MVRLAVVVALVYVTGAAAATPPPDRTYPYTVNGVKFRCAQWGSPPKQFVIACVPVKKPLPKGAA